MSLLESSNGRDRAEALPPRLPSWLPIQLQMFTRRQWRVAGWAYVGSLLVMGVLGETLPIASIGRGVPVEWWNYVTLAISPVLIGLIAATFVPDRQPKSSRRRGAAGAGVGGAIGTLAMACPVCNPIAIPLFGTAGALSFLAPERGLISLLSVVVLAVTLALRFRTMRSCGLRAPVQTQLSAGSEREPASLPT
jgi:hypothetical protein